MNKRELVKEFILKHRYFTLEEVVKASGASTQVAKNYLQGLKQKKIIFSAGRGVYSSVAKEFRPTEKSRVIEIRQLLKKQFPYLDFLVWNTLCFQPYYHHQQTHNITFVEVESDAIRSVVDMISREYRFVVIEKASRVAPKNFDITRDPIVVRRLIKGSPYKGHMPTLEKMLVDLFVIKNKYVTMQDSDYWDLWRNIDKLFRVNIGRLISYARVRRYFRDMFSQLTYNVELSNITFGAYVKYAAKVTSKKDAHDKANS
ncbi:MAG: hypothetical protein KJ893_01960 [Candidatus Omnitrophica bacterium]|nr:hypothetical protein [Candidatus Omnitrophota bacterium]MBU4478624.1 hypothetical protein [Candidatus Omnitrophota bacterium]